MTNLQFIRKATVEDLAKFIEKMTVCGSCPFNVTCASGSAAKGCRETIREWLNKEHKHE
jgi:hypothetical protein